MPCLFLKHREISRRILGVLINGGGEATKDRTPQSKANFPKTLEIRRILIGHGPCSNGWVSLDDNVGTPPNAPTHALPLKLRCPGGPDAKFCALWLLREPNSHFDRRPFFERAMKFFLKAHSPQPRIRGELKAKGQCAGETQSPNKQSLSGVLIPLEQLPIRSLECSTSPRKRSPISEKWLLG